MINDTLGGSGKINMKIKEKFGDFLVYLKKKGLTEHSIGEYKRFLYGALSHSVLTEKKIEDLKMIDVASVIEAGKVHGEYGPQRAVVVLRRYLKFLKNSGMKLPFDWRDIEVPKVPEKEQAYLTEEEFNSFVEKIPLNTLYGLRDRALYEILFSTGARIGEILSLNRSDIDWEKKEAKVKGKGGDEGMIYFSDRSLEWLKKYLETRTDDCSALFVTYHFDGIRPLSKVNARKHLLNYRKKFGIDKKITHHAFRRSFCSLLLDRGATIKEVQYLARHKSERTTLRFYIKVEKRKAKEVHQKIFKGI
jgi:site-specific recombinase XerD